MSTSRHIPALDGARALAIFGVVAFHAWALFLHDRVGETVAQWFMLGMVGVKLFFVLSGFLLIQPWLRRSGEEASRPSLRRYFRHRAWRILPAYYAHLLFLALVMVPLFSQLIGDGRFTDLLAFNLWMHLPLMHFSHPGSASSLGQNMALWSLTLEIQFYLLLPLIARWFVGRYALPALLISVAISLLWFNYAPMLLIPLLQQWLDPSCLVVIEPLSGQPMRPGEHVLELFVVRQLPGEWLFFAVGMYLGKLTSGSAGRDFLAATKTWLLPLFVIVLVAGLVLVPGHPDVVFNAAAQPLMALQLALFLLLLLHDDNVMMRFFSTPVLRWIGIVSYSLFLWHEPVFRLIRHAMIKPIDQGDSVALLVMAACGAALAVAAASYYLVERPFIRQKS